MTAKWIVGLLLLGLAVSFNATAGKKPLGPFGDEKYLIPITAITDSLVSDDQINGCFDPDSTVWGTGLRNRCSTPAGVYYEIVGYFGAVVDDTNIDQCDLSMQVEAANQSWSTIAFGAGGSPTCDKGNVTGDLDAIGEYCFRAAPTGSNIIIGKDVEPNVLSAPWMNHVTTTSGGTCEDLRSIVIGPVLKEVVM
jgi:hypothetical protein